MQEYLLFYLAGIVALGVFAQWLAWRIHVPSILLLLLFGILCGPVLGWLNPDLLFGHLLTPMVSLSVALILFEGALGLRVSELKQTGNVVRNLVTVGVLITWVIATLSAYWLLKLPLPLSTLLGAIMVVSGPTVIGPLLKFIRPTGAVGPVAKWEGIVIDPIGAILAVIIFEVIVAGQFYEAAFKTIVFTQVSGVLAGGFGAVMIIFLFRYHWVPDFLHNVVTLSLVFLVYSVSNYFQSESGLLGVTVMGVILANQKVISVKHIAEFKENLTTLLISGVFIILAARMSLDHLSQLGWSSLLYLVILVFVARPLVVWVSTWRSSLSLQEKTFLACLAPRGIVAAAVSAFFAIRLEQVGIVDSDRLVSVTFMVIVGTVALYGLTLPAIARGLKVSFPNPQGVLILGAHSWAREIGRVLKESNFSALVVDNDWVDIHQARMAGLDTYFSHFLSEHVLDDINLAGIGKCLALTRNEELNSLGILHFSQVFGRADVYQLPVDVSESQKVSQYLKGRLVFNNTVDFKELNRRFLSGEVLKKTVLSEEFTYEDFKKRYGSGALTLFVITEGGKLNICTADKSFSPQIGQTLISLIRPENSKT